MRYDNTLQPIGVSKLVYWQNLWTHDNRPVAEMYDKINVNHSKLLKSDEPCSV